MMVSDSIANASVPNSLKDFAKKKRVNRSAKLKQCKLDARREQWLSQVKNKGFEEGVNIGKLNEPMIGTWKKAHGLAIEEIIHHESDSVLSNGNIPMSSFSNDSVNSCSGSSSNSSSFSGGGSSSGNITEEEGGGGDEGDEDDGCLDDWEVMADALAATITNEKQGKANLSHNNGSGFDLGLGLTNEATSHEKVESRSKKLGKNVEKDKRKAWRPDDASRPQNLPNLSKQRSFPASFERPSCDVVNPWVHCSIPTSCPICCEDLDLTDSNFLPCLCGFRLCLFCHKRILEEDGRCPGCRKPYGSDIVEKNATLSGCGQKVCLARSCSMFPRVN